MEIHQAYLPALLYHLQHFLVTPSTMNRNSSVSTTVSALNPNSSRHNYYHLSHIGLQKYPDGIGEAVDRRTAVVEIASDIYRVIAIPSSLAIAEQGIPVAIRRRH